MSNELVDQVAQRVRPAARWALGHKLPALVMRVSARRGDLQGRMIVASGDGDPFPIFEEIRAHGPLYKGGFSHVATSQQAVREVLSSPDFRTGFDPGDIDGPLGAAFRWADSNDRLGPLEPPSLLVTEPPDHTRYRKLVTRVFTARAVERLRERTQQIADELLDDLVAMSPDGTDTVDIVAAYCMMLPVTVIAEVLGVPLADRDRVLSFGAGAAPSLDMGLRWTQYRQVERSLAQFEQWLGAHLETLRANPGDDLLSQLVLAQEDGVGLDDRELKATAGLVLAAGFETTVNLLGNGIALLRENPEQLERLRAEPDLWPNAVDEVLRIDPPVLLTGRTATRDATVAGMPVAAGSLVTTVLAAANRDPEVFEHPTRFDVARPNAREHVAFSAGRHHCLGAALARMEGEVGLRTLFDRFPDLAIAPGGGLRRDTRILRGYAYLPLRLGAEATVTV